MLGVNILFCFKVTQLQNPFSGRMSYGILAKVVEDDNYSYAAYIPDISCDKSFVDSLALRCSRGQLDPIHLLDVVLDALP